MFQWWVEVSESGVLWPTKASVWNSPEKGERKKERERERRDREREGERYRQIERDRDTRERFTERIILKEIIILKTDF